MSHAVYRQLTPPTGVEFCIHSHFTAEEDDNLIVAKTSCLEIYRLIQQVQAAKKKVLQLVSIYYTSGNIDSLNTIKLQGSKTDSLILSFRDAKISIIEFDQSINAVKLVSMHYYEKAPRSKLSPVQFSIEPFVRVDPDYRCAAALVYDVSLAIIPFRYQSEDLLDDFAEKYGDSNDKILPSFLIDLPSMGIVHVKDIIFLEEYFQPTLLILHEPKQTWSGRLAIHRNSCVLTAISLKLSSKQHPVIWSIEDLPYDSVSLLSVPKPLGGAIVNCVNGIIYCNQSIKYQLLLNAFTPISTNTPYPIEISKFFITLDAARFCFLSPERILASLKGGELFFFELVSNGKTIEKIEISKGGSSVITTSMCLLSNNYIFLGSRLGDSILIHYENNLISTVENSDFPPNKYQRTSNEIETEDFQDINDIDEDFFYRTTSNTSTAKRTFNFTVKDSLLNTGPIVDLEIAESTDPASTSTSEIDSRKTNVEIVTCSGNGKGGSLSVLQGGMRPQIITSFNLPGCKSIWTVYSDKQTKGAKRKQRDWEEETPNETSTNVDHSLLILSTDKRTMVLDTAEGDLSEISNESSLSLSTDQRTLNVSNMMGTKRILQITKFDVRFIANKHKLLQKITYPTPILDSVVLDQYAIIFLKDSVELLSLSSNGNKLKQTQMKLNPKREHDEITACCLYKDTPGKHPLFPLSDNNSNQNYMLVSRLSGAMEIYKIEGIEFILLFESSRFSRGPSLITHESDNINESSQKIGRRRISLSSSSNVVTAQRFVVEILLLNFASELKSPFLIAITDTNDLLIYESFHYEGKLRFSRFTHNFFIRPLVLTPPSNSQKSNDQNNLNNSSNEISSDENNGNNNDNNHRNDNDNDNDDYNNNRSNRNEENNQQSNSPENGENNKQNGETNEENEKEEKEKEEVGYKTKRLFPFTHGNKCGIFLGGLRPAWLVCERDYLRIFPMNIDHNVHCYADFNNTKSCPNGFVYSSKNSALNISRIIPLMNYDFHWPLKKINLRLPGQFFTPHHVVYYKQTKSFIVSVSFRRPMVNPPLPIEEMGGIPKYEDVYEMRLYSPEQNWASIDMYPFEESEHILSVALAQLTVKDSDTGTSSLKPFVLVGTGYLQGENISCKGRIVIFEIITPPSSQQGVMGNPKYKFIHAKSEKGSVSAVSSVQGNIILSIGPKVLMYSFESEKELIGKAFFDAQIYIVSIKTFKNYIVVSDMYKSIVFLIWKRWSRQLVALSKDYNQLAVTDTDFIVFRNKLRVLVADQSKNLQFFHFDPKSVDSREGQMLLPTTDFHLGSQVTKFRHLRINENKDHENPGCASIFGTVDGSLGIIIPIEEEVYDRLLTLQSMMISGLPHFAGLNPKAFRKFKPMYKTLRPKCTTILDGELLMKYLSLEVGYQREFAKLIGTTPDHILNNLLSIELSSTFF